MRRLQEREKTEIQELLNRGLKNLLRFKASYDLHRYLLDRTRQYLSNVAEELHSAEYPTAGTGIRTTRAILTAKDWKLDEHILSDVPLAPEDQVAEVETFPFEAASASYVFSILEDVGNSVIEKIYPGSIKKRSSWHAGVYGDLNLKSQKSRDQARDALAKVFSVLRKRIPATSIRRLVWLKLHRNAFIHDLEENIDFERFFQFTLVLLCQISFLALPGRREIKCYPYEDHLDQFE